MKTAVDVMREDLLRKQIEINECTTEWGYVLEHRKEDYQILVRECKDLEWAINWFERNIYANNK